MSLGQIYLATCSLGEGCEGRVFSCLLLTLGLADMHSSVAFKQAIINCFIVVIAPSHLCAVWQWGLPDTDTGSAGRLFCTSLPVPLQPSWV